MRRPVGVVEPSRVGGQRTCKFLVEIPVTDPVVAGHLVAVERGTQARRNMIGALQQTDTSAYLKITRVG